MGRAFEFRKSRKMKRWGQMAKAFTKLSKEITLAVKQGGPDPQSNLRLKTAILNAKDVSMPKDKIEGAIKRATDKGEQDIQEVVYEGYGPGGIAIVVETATDNPTRTVGNIRSYFLHAEGSLAKTGALDFLFERKGVFTFKAEGINADTLELELIDYGAEEFAIEEQEAIVYTQASDFNTMQKALDQKGITVTNAEIQRFPTISTEVSKETEETILSLIEKIEEDEDVQRVYHNMK